MFFFRVLKQYFPNFKSWIKNLNDPRMKYMCTYPLEYMIFIGIMLFLLKIGTRRQLKYKLYNKQFIKNLNKYLSTDLMEFLHDDTLEYFCRKFSPDNLELLLKKMLQRLLRMKKLTDYRLFDLYYLVALDGTGSLTFNHDHCDRCLTRKTKNGDLLYYHAVLEAKLITENGLAFSIGTEFIENEKRIKKELSDKEKQDCEITASKRLVVKLKRNFPQLNICILGDGLYANQQIMQICKDNAWQYIITFKEGCIPNVYQEFESLKKFHKRNTKEISTEKVEQRFQWMNDIDHEGHKVNIIECKETVKKTKEVTTFCYITNFEITKNNAATLANKGGRLRWKIENEGFNMQKNGGYNLEHQYSRNETAIKNYYLFMQVAHMINQLVEKSNLVKKYLKHCGGIKNLSKRLIDELNYLDIDFDKINTYNNFYITFDTG